MASGWFQVCCINCQSSNIEVGNSLEKLCRDCGTLQSNGGGTLQSFEAEPNTFAGLQFCRNSCEPETFKYREFISRTIAVVNVLGLPESFLEHVKSIVKQVWSDDNLKRRRNTSAKIATCIYCAIRNYPELNLDLKEIARACQTRVVAVKRCYHAFRKVMYLEYLPGHIVEDYLERVALFVSAKHKMGLVENAILIGELTNIEDMGGCKLVGAICLIITAAAVMNIKYRVIHIAKHFDVHKQAVYSRSSQTRNRLFRYSERIPWRPPGLNVKNITAFVPEILRYYKEFGDDSATKEESLQQFVDINEKISIASEEIRNEIRMKENGGDVQLLKMSNDSQVLLIKELFRKGCTEEELHDKSLVSLSKKYLDLMRDDYSDDDEVIPDDEIYEYLKSNEEIDNASELKEEQLQNLQKCS